MPLACDLRGSGPGVFTVSQNLIGGALRFVVWLVSLLPLRAARAVGRFAGRVMWWSGGRAATVTRENIDRCFPQLDDARRREMACQSLQHTGTLAMESGVLWHWSDARWQAALIGLDGMDLIHEAQASGRSVLVLVPHFGNWEFFALLLGPLGYVCLYDPPRIESLEKDMVKARERTGGTLLPIGRRGVRTLAKNLDEGGISVLLPDQVPDPKSGVMASFYGQDALTMTLVQKLARRADCVAVASIMRVPGGFDVLIEKVPEAVGHEDAVLAANALNQMVERVVARDPVQYQWEYKRFKQPRQGKAVSF